jgi:hypothetical protein
MAKLQKAGNALPTTIRWHSNSAPRTPNVATAKPVDYVDAQLCWSDNTVRLLGAIGIFLGFTVLPLLFLVTNPLLGVVFVFLFVGYGLISHLLPERKRKAVNAPITAQLSAQTKATALAHNKRSALGNASAQRLSAPKKRLSAPHKRLPQARLPRP